MMIARARFGAATRAALIAGSALACGCWDFGMLGKSVCDTDPTALCDDFETGAISPSRWPTPIMSTGATVTVDNIRAHGGRYALHAKVPAANLVSQAGISSAPAFAPAPSLFVRTWVYAPAQDLAATAFGGITNGSLEAIADGAISGKVGIANSIGMSTTMFQSQTIFPVDRWVCLELEIDTTPQQVIVFMDGRETLDLPQATITTDAPPKQIELGVLKFNVGATPPGEVFVDDVVVSFKGPVGCGP